MHPIRSIHLAPPSRFSMPRHNFNVSRPRSLARYSIATIIALVALGLSASCSDSGPRSVPPGGGAQGPGKPALIRRGVVLSLADHFSTAEVHTALNRITFSDPAEERYLTYGWYEFEDLGEGRGRSWTRKRGAAVDIPIVRKADRRISIAMQSHREDGTPPKAVKILWNGSSVGVYTVPREPGEIEVDIPSGDQRWGLNRLELLPSYWVRPTDIGESPDERDLGIQVNGIEITKTESKTRSDVSSGAGASGAIADEETVRLLPDTALSYYFELPRGAKLTGSVRLVSLGDSRDESDRTEESIEPPDGVFVIALTEANGTEHELILRDLDALSDGKPFGIDEALEPWAESMVALNIAFSARESADAQAQNGAGSILLELKDLRIEGVAEDLARDGIDSIQGDYNVLVVLFDTLRADHIEAYSPASRARTPRMNALASGGATFMNAYSVAPWTRPSVASLLTGFYPSIHKVSQSTRLSADIAYLPQTLNRLGYKTLCVTNNVQSSSSFGFERGFDAMHEIYKVAAELEMIFDPEAQAERVWTQYVEPLIEDESDRPFFAYLHEIDPHAPYTPPAPYDAMYRAGLRGFIDSSRKVSSFINDGSMKLDPGDVRYLDSQYSGEVTFMDSYLGWILDRLESSGLRRNTLVVFVSDHGEEFMEHGGIRHGRTLHEELLRIPMIFSLPGVLPEGATPRTPVQLVDVAPTILDLLGLESPGAMQGRSLLPLMLSPDHEPPSAPVFAMLNSEMPWWAMQVGNWKFIRRQRKNGRMEFMLFDRESDPTELIDLWPQELIRGKTLAQSLRRRLLADSKDGTDDESAKVHVEGLSAEALENLRALGYID